MDLNLAAAVSLVLITAAYSFFTWRLAVESQKARLANDEPRLVFDAFNLGDTKWTTPPNGTDEEAYPEAFKCRVLNAGRGAALEIGITAAHSQMSYKTVRKDFLGPGEESSFEIESWPFVDSFSMSSTQTRRFGLSSNVNALTKSRQDLSGGYDCGVLLSCSDVHGGEWVTFQLFALLSKLDANNKVIDRELRKELLQIVPGKSKRLPVLQRLLTRLHRQPRMSG